MVIDVSVLITAIVAAIGAITVIGGFCAACYRLIKKALKPIKDLQSDAKLLKFAVKAVLKNAITRDHREFMTQGHIGRYGLESVLEMYRQYKALDGNGFVDELVDDLKRLPIEMGATAVHTVIAPNAANTSEGGEKYNV